MNWAVGRFGDSAVRTLGVLILLTAQPPYGLTAQDYRAEAIRILRTVPLIEGHHDLAAFCSSSPPNGPPPNPPKIPGPRLSASCAQPRSSTVTTTPRTRFAAAV